MNKEIIKYLNLLRLNSVIYDDRIIEYMDDNDKEYILSDTYLESLIILIEFNRKSGHLCPHVVDNILDTLTYIRKEKGNSSIINSLIRELNDVTYNKYLYFYRDQYLKRSGMYTSKSKKKYSIDSFSSADILSELRFSMMLDYDIILCLIEDTDEEVEDMEEVLVSDYFLNTINAIAYECPQIFKIDGVKERIKDITHKIVEKSYDKDIDLDVISRYRSKQLSKRLKKD